MMLVASTVVMIILAYALVSVLTQQLVSQKEDTALQELDRARVAVEQQIDATGTANSTQVRINSARAALGQLSAQQPDAQAVYEPVIVVENSDGTATTSPEGYRIPGGMRELVGRGQVVQQYATVDQQSGATYNALMVGTPIESDIPNTQVYLVLSMESEESTMALMRGLLSAAGVVVVVLLVGIAWLATQQVIVPIRSASRIAQRFAAGHLRERMVVNSDDEMGRLASSFNDMADKLSKQITQLEEYGDLQRQFTSDVSHELRTPLTTVRMAADVIAEDADEFNPYTKRSAELLIKELDRFEDLLADLLEISRHDAGVADLSTASIDIRSCVDSALSQVEHLASELGVEVVLHLPEEPVAVECDSRRVERILRNLLANAIDHSEGNPVIVDVGATEDAVGIAVTDSGVGLKEGQEELVFNRFWRADSSRKRHSGGTGLGLAIAREDAVLHGGTLDAIGYYGVGSRFRLILPRTPGQQVESEPIALELPGAPKPIEAEEQSALELSAYPEAPAVKGETDNGIVWPSEREARAVDPPFNKDSVPDFEEEAQR
ncbi:HAMP domain-containing histidine kinase [Corynebacterium aurimucosum]|uniref:MtrAB system histidine kinase MtrB n=1 Tax=Corynebacterium TaxID=1716 RepID=UPI00187945A2|nr:HAMP domain-containing histidine kinase [Corynebacterium aurimucosum]MBE7365220.1 HAMP domain-containing histidine kinase [Corynebacterium aurimucosum]MCZ9297971.1 HAMP domain-containing histidine kinase [Corynebacterium hesseae]